jgi:membrane protein DedA with SNARE-associated domain
MSPLESFLSEHGLVALLLLATIEGDLSILVGGVLAHLGLLPLPGVVVAGALGNLLGDSAWFAVGRQLRERIRGNPLYRAMGPRIERLAGRIGPWQLLAARVVWGTRNASMIFWGQHGLALGRFLLVDAIGCATAATAFALLGFGVGHGAQALAGELKRVEEGLLVGVIVGGLLLWGISRGVRRRLER